MPWNDMRPGTGAGGDMRGENSCAWVGTLCDSMVSIGALGPSFVFRMRRSSSSGVSKSLRLDGKKSSPWLESASGSARAVHGDG